MLKTRFIFLLLLTGAMYGCSQVSAIFGMQTQRPAITDWSWTKEEWTGAETPFIQIDRNINQSISKKQSFAALAKRYKAAAQKEPSSPKAQYAWGYLAVVAAPPGHSIDRKEIQEIALGLARPNSPKTSSYARVRFIATMRWRPHPQLKDLGRRLLRRNPKDYLVKYHIINLLVIGTKQEQQQALSYARDLVRAQPKRASAWSALGWAYDNIFLDQKDVAIGDKAIAAYRKFIQLSKSPQARKKAERFITLIQREQKKLK